MYKGIYILLLSLFTSCVTKSNGVNTLDGTWVYKDADIKTSDLILKEHVLNVSQSTFKETYSENNNLKNSTTGNLFVKKDKNAVEIKMIDDVEKVYTGYVQGDTLVVESIDNTTMTPPVLYKRV